MYDMLGCASKAVDLVSPRLDGHHRRTAYIALRIGEEAGLSQRDLGELIVAGSLHDIGALDIRDRLDELSFEHDSPYMHSELGYRHLRNFVPFSDAAELVRYHHVPWEGGRGRRFRDQAVPLGSHILHLAERIDLLIGRKRDIMDQVPEILKAIRSRCSRNFMPDLTDIFRDLAGDRIFWLGLMDSAHLDMALKERSSLSTVIFDLEGLIGFTKLICRIIDFRSRYTSVHSTGVAAVSEALAITMDMPGYRWKIIRAAGYLHDLGKLGVPVSILEKPGKLTKREQFVVRRHSFDTFETLDKIKGLETINAWASFHHERLDGGGYPFGKTGEELSIGSRIIAVADVFTALMEDRPYRKGMEVKEVFSVMDSMGETSALDKGVIQKVKRCYDEINFLRLQSQKAARMDYQIFGLPV